MAEGGVQFYTANFQNGAGTRKKIHGGVEGGDGYPKEGECSHNSIYSFNTFLQVLPS